MSTFASTSCMYLSLENVDTLSNIKSLSYLFCLFGSCGDLSLLDKDSEFSHQVLALILVEVEESLDVKSESLVEGWLDQL